MKRILGTIVGVILMGLAAATVHAYDSAVYGISGIFNEARKVHAVDFDNDGDMDIIGCSESDDDVCWFENNGNGIFSRHDVDTAYNDPYSVYGADINKDGQMDIAVVSFDSDNVRWYANNGDGTFTSNTVTSAAYDGAADVVVVDMDGDTDLDFVTVAYNADAVTWWENDGSNYVFTEHTIEAAFDGAYRLEVVDLDGDTDLDVVAVASEGDDVAWWENDGSQNFTIHTIEGAFDNARDVTVIDMDGDTDLDVVAVAASANSVTWWENDGSQNFTAHVIDNASNVPYAVVAEDFDRDGDIDVAASANSDDLFYWYENDGSEVFTRKVLGRNYSRDVYDLAAVNLDSNSHYEIVFAERNRDFIGYCSITPYQPAAQLQLVKTTMYPTYCSMDRDGYTLFTGSTVHAEIDIINVQDPENPVLISEFNTSGGDEYNPARWVQAQDGFLYISNREEGLFQSVSLADLSHPVLADEISLSNNGGDFVLRDPYAYVGDSNGNVLVVNIANPFSMSAGTSVNIGDDVTGMAAKGNYLYCLNRWTSELVVLDISTPSSPVIDNTLVLGAPLLFAVAIQGNYAYITGHYEDLLVVDISDPQHPRQVGHVSSPGWSTHIALADHYAFVSYVCGWYDNQMVGVNMIDIADPANPVIVQSYVWEEALGSSSNEGIKGLAVHGNYLYAGQWTKGLMIFKWKSDPDPSLTPEPTPVANPFDGFMEKYLDEVVTFPNPARGDVTFLIEDDNAEKVQIDVFNMSGERVASIKQDNPGQTVAWQTGNLAAGIYLYQTVVTVNGEQKKYKPKKLAISK